MAKPLDNPSAKLVGDLGGVQIVAEKLNKSHSAIRMWAHRNVVPRSVWPELISAFPKQLTLAKLRDIEGRAA
jgi:hypothetical protein